MGAPADSPTEVRRRGLAPRRLPALVAAFLAAALGLTWWRLHRGADLVDEAYFVLVPWRWTLGDRPFVDEQNLSQSAGLLAYPFVKVFALVRGHDVAGLVLFDRYLYLGLALAAAACVFLLARRSLPPAVAALVAAPCVTVLLFETPQLTANTLCAYLLTAGGALGAVAVLGGPRISALAAGVACGLAGVAYPTVLLMTPFVAVLLAFSLGGRAVTMAAEGSWLRTAGAEEEPSGPRAWRVLSAWVAGWALVVVPAGVLVVALAGLRNLRRGWDYTIALADQLDQLGGASKAVEVAGAFAGLLADQWYIVLAAVLSLLVFRRRPDAGRWLLLLTPPALWLTAQTSSLHAAAAVIAYALAAPYLYLFVPAERRMDGARLLFCVWAPAVLVGAMIAYTSADGFLRSAVGLLPGVVVSGLFLAWGLAPLRGSRAWPAVLGLGAVVLVLLAFQVQFQVGGVGWRSLSATMDAGPWRGIALTPGQRAGLERFSRDLAAAAHPGDGLLVYPQGAGYYLYWPGEITSNTYQTYVGDPRAVLPKATVSYFRRHRVVPALVARLGPTAAGSAAALRAENGGLEYPALAVAPGYALYRRPAAETVDEVLARLPRL